MAKATRTLIVHPYGPAAAAERRSAEARLAEAVGLAEAIRLKVVDAWAFPLRRAHPATLFGSGRIAEIAERVAEAGASLVFVDAAVSAVQQRNLERAWDAKVIDRTGLILEIFGARARTAEGRLQVELAHLTYQRSRLVRSWTHLERQRGGYGFLGGPGEAQIEVDRRIIGDRIAHLRRELEDVRRTRGLHRTARRRVPYPVVALVGYTNAGKSTLFNTLTRSDVMVRDQVFATLDPTMRALELASGRTVILSDTVGFISELPTHLVAAFRATLEEVVEADVLVHVRDMAHPDRAAQKEDVEAVLRKIGLDGRLEVDVVEALNKIDLLDTGTRRALMGIGAGEGGGVPVSALTGEGLEALLARLDAKLAADEALIDVSLDLAEGAALAWLYDHGEVIARRDDERGMHLTVRLAPPNVARFRRRHPAPAARLTAH